MCYSVDCEGVCEDGHRTAVYMAIEACSTALSTHKSCEGPVVLGLLRCTIPTAHCETCCLIASPRETTRLLAESCDERIRDLMFWQPRPEPDAKPVEEWVKYVQPFAGMILGS
ncbi:unnamed protein product [Clonostachys rhizophaga]|uniref:Uncharacterized protein n=1 Tax=Clonostachys rhizophaga TaxID=160324 RepID=A0A9N9W3Y7_9HYPO|nr:unnamed protein product [Clonostachys rhizophaga]